MASDYMQGYPGYDGNNVTEIVFTRSEQVVCDDWQKTFEGCIDTPVVIKRLSNLSPEELINSLEWGSGMPTTG